MTRLEIEAWTLRTVENICSGSPHEDSAVECKSRWPDPTKVGRQLAGHANAAKGEPILWVIGLDREQGLVGADEVELSNWWNIAKSQFDEVAPPLQDLIVPAQGKSVVALLFETDRAPFVVKSKDGLREIPWRDGTGTISARRSDLVRLLAPAAKLPDFEILGAGAILTMQQHRDLPTRYRLDAYIWIYVVPKTEGRVVLPFHRTHCSIQFPGKEIQLDDVRFGRSTAADSLTIRNSATEMIIDGPGSFILRSSCFFDEPPNFTGDAKILVESRPAGTDIAAVLTATLGESDKGAFVARWGEEPF
jgi:hypothetical protein